MRSLVGLIAVILTATFYLYLLSSYLPPGPQLPKKNHEGETRKSNDDEDNPNEKETAASRCASLACLIMSTVFCYMQLSQLIFQFYTKHYGNV